MIAEVRESPWSAFARGFRAVLPLWLGMIPFGLAYAVTARAAGLSVLDTQLMSVLVFAGGAQFSAAGMFGAGASAAAIVLTTFLLNARHVLYGLSLGRELRLSWPRRVIAAYFLTDEAYGVTVAARERRFAFLLGAELSVFVSWNAATFAGAVAGASIPDPAALGVDFVFPLAFLALLVPLLRSRPALVVAVAAGMTALVAARWLPSGPAVLVAGVLASALGAFITRDEDRVPGVGDAA